MGWWSAQDLWRCALSDVPALGPLDLEELGVVKRSRTQSEFGGRSGLIQSVEDGHVNLTSREELAALYATDPAEPSEVPDRERVGERPRQW